MGHALKRYLATAALGATALSLAACGADVTEPSTPKPSDTAAPKVTKESSADTSTEPTSSPSATARSGEAAPSKDEAATDLADGDECQGEDITVESSMESPLNLTGDCGIITLSGEGIVLKVENAAGIVDKSGKNTVSGGALGDISVVGDASTFEATSVGTLRLEGNMNTVKTSTVESVWVAGDGNTVTWEEPLGAAPETLGSANTLTGPQ